MMENNEFCSKILKNQFNEISTLVDKLLKNLLTKTNMEEIFRVFFAYYLGYKKFPETDLNRMYELVALMQAYNNDLGKLHLEDKLFMLEFLELKKIETWKNPTGRNENELHKFR